MKICILIYANHHARETERFLQSFVQENLSLENFIIYNAGNFSFQKIDTYSSVLHVQRTVPSNFLLIEKCINRILAKFQSLQFIALGILNYYLFNKFLKEHKISSAVVFEANTGYGSEFFFKACKKKSLQLYILPYSFASWLEPCISYYNNSNMAILKLPFWSSAKWFSSFKGKLISRLQPLTTLLLDILGFSPFRPTSDSSASVGTYILESKAFADHLTREGIDPGRIVVGGSYNLSLLTTAVGKNKISRKLTKRRIVFQLPPDITESYYYFHMSDGGYNNLLKKMFTLFESYKDEVDFVLILHPLTLIPDSIVKNSNIILSKNLTIYDAIASCDAYIASISSTIRWALALHLPVINFDFYKFGYTEFVCAENLCYVDNFEDFSLRLRELVDSLISKKQNKVSAIFSNSAFYWGELNQQFPKKFMDIVQANLNSN